MLEALTTTDTTIASVQEISNTNACFVGPLRQTREGQLIEVYIPGHDSRKARIVGYLPGGYRLDFTEQVFGETPPQSTITGTLTVARTVVFQAQARCKSGKC